MRILDDPLFEELVVFGRRRAVARVDSRPRLFDEAPHCWAMDASLSRSHWTERVNIRQNKSPL